MLTIKAFHYTDNYAIINFDLDFCVSEVSIIKSSSFKYVFSRFIDKTKVENINLVKDFLSFKIDDFINMFSLLIIDQWDNIANKDYVNPMFKCDKNKILILLEEFYDYWRNVKRYGIIRTSRKNIHTYIGHELIDKAEKFNTIVLQLYRTIAQNIQGHPFYVFRQLPAGINANLMYVFHRFNENPKYEKIQDIPLITSVLTKPPFIIYSKSNTRQGLFQEISFNPLPRLAINRLHYFIFPIKVGLLLAFVYIHRDFLHHGIGLSNLFEFSQIDYSSVVKPDIIYIYGIREEEYDCKYYHDEIDQIYLGFVSRNDKNDYFGYLKKMLLTLHNLHMIDRKRLPIHGAMVSIEMNNGIKKNIVIIGDSGAGKSETLEALRMIAKGKIADLKVIFDDMGAFFIDNDKIYANGTEIGAFVRLDDLDAGYAYKEIDRAIFVNPNKQNSRIILPVSPYSEIVDNHKIDIVLYANNYIDSELGVELLDNIDDALCIFRKGERVAKGTTSEIGLVSSYFANPFGPVQREKDTDNLLVEYFTRLFESNTLIGVIYTKLAIPNQETSGPIFAAKSLLDLL